MHPTSRAASLLLATAATAAPGAATAAGPDADAVGPPIEAAASALARLEVALSALDPADPASPEAARTRLLAEVRPDAPAAERSASVRRYLAFLQAVADRAMEDGGLAGPFAALCGDPDAPADAVAAAEARLRRLGLTHRCPEGTLEVDVDPVAVLDGLEPVLAPADRAYLALLRADQREPYAEDGALRRPVDALRRGVRAWERFLDEHPGSPHAPDVETRLDLLVGMYLDPLLDVGSPRDPAARRCPPGALGAVSRAGRASYERFLAEDGASRFHRRVAAAYERLKAAGFCVMPDYYGQEGPASEGD